MAKARHYRKTNRRWLPLLLVLVVLAAVGVFVGAVLVQENTSYEGNILPDDVILSERQWLFPQENGGFFLLSTEEGISSEEQQNFTKGPPGHTNCKHSCGISGIHICIGISHIKTL